MIGRQDRWQEDLFVAGQLSSLIPEDHILKQVDKVLALSWLREEVKDLYCCDNGRPGIDPEVAVINLKRLVAHTGLLFAEFRLHLRVKLVAERFDVPIVGFSANRKRNFAWNKAV